MQGGPSGVSYIGSGYLFGRDVGRWAGNEGRSSGRCRW